MLSEILEYKNPTGSGNLFDAIIADNTVVFRAVGYNQMVDEFYRKFNPGCQIELERSRYIGTVPESMS